MNCLLGSELSCQKRFVAMFWNGDGGSEENTVQHYGDFSRALMIRISLALAELVPVERVWGSYFTGAVWTITPSHLPR